jgi:hypothetical protein
MTVQTDVMMDDDAPAPVVKIPPARTPTVARQSQGDEVVDGAYTLWLATTATALMGGLSLTLALVIYLIDNALMFSGGSPIFTPDNYRGMLELSAIFAAAAVGAHFLRLRLEALKNAVIVIPLPFRIVVEPPLGDTRSRFECSCKVALGFDDERPIAPLTQKPDVLKKALENAFIVAVSDPVIRYSKQKMEKTLKVAAMSVLGEGVSHVEMTDVRQRRLPPQQAPAKAKPRTRSEPLE